MDVLRNLKSLLVNIFFTYKSNYYIFWLFLCSLSYSAWKAQAPYFIVICRLSGCTIFFSTLFWKRHDFREMLLNIIYVFRFSLQLWNFFHSKKYWASYDQNYTQVPSMQCGCAVLYCHLWPVWIYHISSKLSEKTARFSGKVTEYRTCVLVFSTHFG